MKMQRKTTEMKKQIRNTEVQINEEERGKLPEKKIRIMVVKMVKNLENKMEKMQEFINKDLKVLKNQRTETTQLLKLKVLQKESIAEYLKQKKESELEDKMVEITSEEQNKVKRIEDSLSDP